MRNFAENKFFKAFLGLILASFVLVSVNEIFNKKSDEIVAVVKNHKITAQELSPLIQKELNQYQQTFGTSLNQEQLVQLKEYILQQVINRKLLEFASDDLGLKISNKLVAEYVLADEAFHSSLGVFDQVKFNEFLAQLNITEEKYLSALKQDLKIRFLIETIMTQHLRPQLIAPHYYNYQKQERQIELISFNAKDLVRDIAPSEDALIKFYDNNLPLFLVPEYRDFSYVALSAKDLALSIVLHDEEIKKEYDETSLDYQNAGLSDSLEKVKEKLIADKSQDALYKLMEKIEDEISSGANISEISSKYNLTITNIKDVNEQGTTTSAKKFPQDEILKLAYDLAEAKECEIAMNKDNSSFFIVQLQKITPSYIPNFLQAKDKVQKHWLEVTLREKELMAAKEVKKKLQENQNITTELNIKTHVTELKLNRTYENLPPKMVEEIFQLTANEASDAYQYNNKTIIAKLKSISYPIVNQEDFNNKLYNKILDNLQHNLSEDTISQYLHALRKRYGVKIM
jgi:peptidyl-prolyl cis-trans isomerase D